MVNLGELLSFNFWSLLSRTSHHHQDLKPIDYSDIAFQIATTEHLDKLLPSILSRNALQSNCTNQLKHYDSLFVLTPVPSKKYQVHSSSNTTPNPLILNYFESLQVAEQEMIQSQRNEQVGAYHFSFFPLQNSESGLVAYLVVVFKGELPLNNETANLLRPFRNALQKGLLSHNKKLEMIANAVKEERQAQASDLHDSIAQILSYLRLRSATLKGLCNESEPNIQKLAKDIEVQVCFAHRLTRELISSSRLTYQESNLSQAFENALEEFKQHSSIVFEMDNRCKDTLEEITHPTETLFIVREALCNLVRHSHATHARVVITQNQEKQLTILIEDNGTGIQTHAKRNDSFGLRIMEERARKMRAQLNISNRQEGGTRVQLEIMREHPKNVQ
ncbi:hypothetical protein JCM30760_20810 [Thiomicrorhabdus hydrogeniphila]